MASNTCSDVVLSSLDLHLGGPTSNVPQGLSSCSIQKIQEQHLKLHSDCCSLPYCLQLVTQIMTLLVLHTVHNITIYSLPV